MYKQYVDTRVSKQSVYFTLAAYACAVVPQSSSVDPAVTLLCLILAAWRAYIAYEHSNPISKRLATLLGILIAIAFLGFSFMSGKGVSTSTSFSALIVFLACLLLQTDKPDKFTNTLLLMPFIPMGFFLIADPLWSIAYNVLFFWMWSAALLCIWSPKDTKTTLAYSGALIGVAVPLIASFYFLIPRPNAWWADNEPKAGTGMSRTLKPGDVGKLSQQPGTAFTATFIDDLPIPNEQLYWRGLVLREYANGQWQEGKPGLVVPNTATMDTNSKYYVFIPKDEGFRYQLEWSSPTKEEFISTTGVVLALSSNPGKSVQVPLFYTPSQSLRAAPDEADTQINADNPRAYALALELKKDNVERTIQSIQSWVVNQTFTYSLEPGSMPPAWIDTFLFERRRGFCEHYAGSIAYMLRSAGYPARVVVGFQGGDYNARNKTYDVPMAAAHAWTEYWSATQNKWVRLDPTAWVAPERIQTSSWRDTSSEARAWFQELNQWFVQTDSSWKIWVTYYDRDQQKMLWTKMKGIDWNTIGLWIALLILISVVAWSKIWYAISPKLSHQLVALRYALNINSTIPVTRFPGLPDVWIQASNNHMYGDQSRTLRHYTYTVIAIIKFMFLKSMRYRRV